SAAPPEDAWAEAMVRPCSASTASDANTTSGSFKSAPMRSASVGSPGAARTNASTCSADQSASTRTSRGAVSSNAFAQAATSSGDDVTADGGRLCEDERVARGYKA